jgi:hypothetical protein
MRKDIKKGERSVNLSPFFLNMKVSFVGFEPDWFAIGREPLNRQVMTFIPFYHITDLSFIQERVTRAAQELFAFYSAYMFPRSANLARKTPEVFRNSFNLVFCELL